MASTQRIRTVGTQTSARGNRAGLRSSETLPPENWGYVEELSLDGSVTSTAARPRSPRRTRAR